MILARALCADSLADLHLGFARMGLPTSARDYVLEKLPHFQLLLTGLTIVEGRFLRNMAEASIAPGREELPAYVPGDQKLRPGTALLSGRKEQLERLRARARAEGLDALARAMDAFLSSLEPLATLELKGQPFPVPLEKRPYWMAVMQDGQSLDAALQQALKLEKAGADLLLVASNSSQVSRALPWAQTLREKTKLPLAVETQDADLARQWVAAGVSLVVDPTGLQDPRMAEVLAASDATCCVVHRPTSQTQTQAQTGLNSDVVEEVVTFLSDAVDRAVHAGLPRHRVWVDPGLGAGKTPAQDAALSRRAQDLRLLGTAIVVGGASDVETLGFAGAADVLRVRDVAAAQEAWSAFSGTRFLPDPGALFAGRLAGKTGPVADSPLAGADHGS